MKKTIYYLPGWGGRLDSGLGEVVRNRGFDVTGREASGNLRQLTFQQQIDAVENDLRTHFWYEEARTLVNSFGAYLFLHAQAQMAPFPGKVLLLSPIVGDFQNNDTRMGFVPPRPERLLGLAQAGAFSSPRQAEIHVGSEDWQSDPKTVCAFGHAAGIKVNLVQGDGHSLNKKYVSALLDEWLC